MAGVQPRRGESFLRAAGADTTVCSAAPGLLLEFLPGLSSNSVRSIVRSRRRFVINSQKSELIPSSKPPHRHRKTLDRIRFVTPRLAPHVPKVETTLTESSDCVLRERASDSFVCRFRPEFGTSLPRSRTSDHQPRIGSRLHILGHKIGFREKNFCVCNVLAFFEQLPIGAMENA